jgi:hypothetical protein
VFALYVAGYSGFRMFEETLRIDYSNHILGMRLNFFVALILCVAALLWFARIQWGWRLRRTASAVGVAWLVASAAGCGHSRASPSAQHPWGHKSELVSYAASRGRLFATSFHGRVFRT